MAKADFSPGTPQDEVAGGVYFKLASGIEAQRDGSGIRMGCNDEIMLQLLLVSIEDQVDSRIDVAISNFVVCRYIRAPLFGVVAHKIVAPSGQLIDTSYLRRSVGTGQFDAHRVRFIIAIFTPLG